MSVTLREKRLASGRKSLYLDVYHNGKRGYEYLRIYLDKPITPHIRQQNKEKMRLAEGIRSKRELDLHASSFDFVPVFRQRTNFIEFFQLEIQKRQRLGKTEAQLSSWYNTLKMLKQFAGDTIVVSAITTEWLEELKEYFLSQVSVNTAYLYMSKIKTAVNAALKQKVLRSNPLLNLLPMRKQETQKTFYSIEEVQQLADTPCRDTEVKRAFLFACYTGLRYSDVQKLTWGDIKGDAIAYRQTKTGNVEYLPLSAMAMFFLGSASDSPHSKVFVLPSKFKVDKVLKEWVQQAGLGKAISFHVSRHTFATLALSYGGDIYTISKLLGHRNLASTQVYAKIIDAKKKQTVDLIPDIVPLLPENKTSRSSEES